jgi:CubicO group peptidase (beta-lactamase class C family)
MVLSLHRRERFRMARRPLAFVLVMILATSCALVARAAEPAGTPVDDLSPLLAESVKKHKLPGMAAAIVDGGRITAIGAAGVRVRGHEEKITADDFFHIGSDTKSMTATLIAVLIEEGKLRWSSTPFEVLSPHGVQKIDPAWQHVTLEELLSHHAGVRPNPELATILATWFLKLSPREQRLRVCRAVLEKRPDQEPGKNFLYSNTGYIIAGAMAEAMADDSWENLMTRRVFQPLGMKHAGFGAPGQPLPTSAKAAKPAPITEPWGHEANGSPVEPGPEADNPPCLGPAGRVHLPLADWARYAALHLSAEPANRHDLVDAGVKPLLSVESLRRLHTPFGGPIDKSGAKYAMGWAVVERPGSRGVRLTHAGSNTVWYAVISLRLAENRAILIGINQGGEGAARAAVEVEAALLKRAGQRIAHH